MKRITTFWMILSVALVSCNRFDSKYTQSVNAIIGDESFTAVYTGNPNDAPEQLRLVTHLRYVEDLLQKANTEHLNPNLKRRRAMMLNLLHDYWKAGIFPVNDEYQNQRRPCFIDDMGRICAVGYLIEQTAGSELAREINEQFQYEYLVNMNYKALTDWVANSGLSLMECAMIQPQYEGSKRVFITERVSHSFYNTHIPSWNPGWTGLDGKFISSASYSPSENATNWNLSNSYMTKKIHGGIGLNYSLNASPNDGYAIHNVDVNYSYHVRLGKERRIGIGMGAGLLAYTKPMEGRANHDTPIITTYRNGYPEDPINFFDLKAGLAYKGSGLSMGYSISRINQPQFEYSANGVTDYYKFHRSHIVWVGYDIELSERSTMVPQLYYFNQVRTNILDFSLQFQRLRYILGMGIRGNYFAPNTLDDISNGGKFVQDAGAFYFVAGWNFWEKLIFGGSVDINDVNPFSANRAQVFLSYLVK